MAVYKHRVQAVLDDERYQLLQELGAERETTVSGLIREAVQIYGGGTESTEAVQIYNVADAIKARRMAAVRRLYEMGQETEAWGEVMADWEELEEEIIQARIAHMEEIPLD